MRLAVPVALVLALAGPAFAAPDPGVAQANAGLKARDPSTCVESWREAKASGSTQSRKAYLADCEKGKGAVQASTSFPAPPASDLRTHTPSAPVAGDPPGPMPAGATAFCGDGSYSTATDHAQACVGHKGVQQFFR
jgi:hypothetical protein